MRELNIGGGKPLPAGIDTRELGMDHDAIRRREEEELTAKLADLRARCIGSIKTNLRCFCRAFIVDHAAEQVGGRRLAPARSLREQVDDFRLQHRYWCDACGLTYQASVIEGSRGWVPLERRPKQGR